ncbi:MAG: hypothetical protein BWY17_04784 [Deltaproteobacteria bacterium ADurb.Bin207]|nr:MAG: hypothetical protein BWY17_04784 [Deltaproteobacteria bacterium ADurb.Bin207]
MTKKHTVQEVSAPPIVSFPPRDSTPTMPPWQGQPAHQLPNPQSPIHEAILPLPCHPFDSPLATKPTHQRRNARPEFVTSAKSISSSVTAWLFGLVTGAAIALFSTRGLVGWLGTTLFAATTGRLLTSKLGQDEA